MNNFLSGKKKIITMILGIVSGLAIIFGVDSGDVSTISGAVVAIGSVVAYIMAEGKIDVERIKVAATAVNEALDIINPVEIEGFVDNEGTDVNVSQ